MALLNFQPLRVKKPWQNQNNFSLNVPPEVSIFYHQYRQNHSHLRVPLCCLRYLSGKITLANNLFMSSPTLTTEVTEENTEDHGGKRFEPLFIPPESGIPNFPHLCVLHAKSFFTITCCCISCRVYRRPWEADHP